MIVTRMARHVPQNGSHDFLMESLPSTFVAVTREQRAQCEYQGLVVEKRNFARNFVKDNISDGVRRLRDDVR
jgi:hypothetical protein